MPVTLFNLWWPKAFYRYCQRWGSLLMENHCFEASLVAQRLKCLPPMQETQVQSLGWEDPLEKEMAIHSSILAWRIPWIEEPGGLQSMGSQRVRHNWVTLLYLTLLYLRLHRDHCPRLNGRLSLILTNPAESDRNSVSSSACILSSICRTPVLICEIVQTLEGSGDGPSIISIIKNTTRFSLKKKKN